MKQTIIGIIIVLVIAIAGVALWQTRKTASVNTQPAPTVARMNAEVTKVPQATTSASASPSSPLSPSAMQKGAEKDFTVTGQNYSFTPNQLTVNKDDTVKITFKNSGGFHDFVIDEFNVKSKTVQTGGEDTVTFTADKAGQFEFYCSIDGHRQMGMKGTLTVK